MARVAAWAALQEVESRAAATAARAARATGHPEVPAARAGRR